jgi:Fic family protein
LPFTAIYARIELVYEPKYSISNAILANIGLIEAAKEVIVNAPLVPVYEARFVKEAFARTVHHTTHLEVEDYDLTLGEVKKVIEGEQLVARERDLQEVINYRNVMKYIDQLAPKTKKAEDDFHYSPKMLKAINEIACQRIVTDGRAGKYRQTQVILRNSATNEIVFRPPPSIEVAFLLEDFFRWLNSASSREINPILKAGITHYYLVAVHPFVEANGRSARAFATLVLFVENYDIRKFFSLEEYFDKDASHYYQALMTVDKNHRDLAKRDLTPWLEYFTQAMAVELTRIKEKVKKISLDIKTRSRIGSQVLLNERQMKLMEYLEENGSITTAEGRKLLPRYSDDTILRDFNLFIKKGIVRKKGRTKAARYVLK